jgi:hypothetical protein
MIGYRTFSWRLTVSNLADAEHLVEPAIKARRRVREAAWHWREDPTETAMKALSQRPAASTSPRIYRATG